MSWNKKCWVTLGGFLIPKATFRVEVEHENGIVLDLNHDSLSSK